MYNKKFGTRGALDTMETIAVLFVFFILLAMGLIFYASYQKSQAEIRMKEMNKLSAQHLAQMMTNLPELRSSRKGIRGVNTFDIFKIQALQKIIVSKDDLSLLTYKEKFGNSIIRVHEIYPSNRTWDIYNNSLEKARSKDPFFIPVSLFDPPDPQTHPGGVYSFGILEVVHYGR